MSTNTYTLCRCNNCFTLMYDENPSDQSYKFSSLDIKGISISNMEPFENKEAKEEDWWEEEFPLGCPECKTDAYLSDITSIEDLQNLLELLNILRLRGLKEKYQQLEAINNHTGAALLLVNTFGSENEKNVMKGIAERHEKAGEISLDDYRIRYEIANKYYQIIKKA